LAKVMKYFLQAPRNQELRKTVLLAYLKHTNDTALMKACRAGMRSALEARREDDADLEAFLRGEVSSASYDHALNSAFATQQILRKGYKKLGQYLRQEALTYRPQIIAAFPLITAPDALSLFRKADDRVRILLRPALEYHGVVNQPTAIERGAGRVA